MAERDPFIEEFFIELQKAIRRLLDYEHRVIDLGKIEYVAAVDAAYRGDLMSVAAVGWRIGEDKPIDEKCLICKAPYPYVPGLLFLREAPPMLKAVKLLELDWQLLLVDGHGILHPRRMGLAVLLGLTLDKPTIGIAKSLLIGSESGGGEFGEVRASGELLGYWFKLDRRKFYASPGYLIDVKQIPEIIRRFGGYPKPLSYADRLSRRMLSRRSLA